MPIRVFIPEAIPSRNKGEVGIFFGIRESLARLGEVKIALASHCPEADRAEYGPEVELIGGTVPTARGTIGKLIQSAGILARQWCFAAAFGWFGKKALAWFRAPLWRVLAEADLILFGHDNVLVGRFPLQLALVPMLAKRLGIPCVVYAGTVGPYAGWGTRWLTRRLLKAVDLVTLREKQSVANVAGLALGGVPVRAVADPAFLMPPCAPERVAEILREQGIPAGREMVGATITFEMARRYASAKGLDEKRGTETYFRARAALLDGLVERHNVVVAAIAHCVEAESRDDGAANRELRRHMRRKDSVFLVGGAYRAQELKGVIGQCVLLIGERTHSMIAATSLGVATVGVSSAITGSKTKGILGEEMGILEWLVDVETMDFGAVADVVERAWRRRADISAGLRGRVEAVRAKSRLPAKLIGERFPELAKKAGRPNDDAA